ncbi:hypothetical protein K458DRAFT_488153 [Lentithecium fluviatile CBS 122367]|uniref:Uncharacterized protein n=1 Tax=Lentithecium fluviatile CBS 122367 TaxID=1168545 RepID=A0A6G1IXD4_9PLEO|nr:hypothetical protein K458DRAFT_488153 [Lentithecium fluviatile CBS 122367]
MDLETPSRTVSGPFLYFTFVCLALNAVAQPTGRVCGTPYNLRFLLRCSPIYNLIDGIGVAAIWIYHWWWKRHGLIVAAAKVVKIRFQEVSADEGESLASIERSRGFRLGVFVFGVLPQVVKLFACRGVVGMQLTGAMYLVPWCLFEMLTACAGRLDGYEKLLGNRDVEAQNGGGNATPVWPSIWKHCALWTHCAIFSFYNIVYASFEDSVGRIVGYIRVVMVLFSAAYMHLLTVEEYARLNYRNTGHEMPFQFDKPEPEPTPDTVRVANGFQCMCTGLALMMTPELWDNIGSWLWIPTCVLGCLAMLFQRKITPLFSAYFSTVMVPLLYFILFWNPSGTYKPSWTELLG